MSQPDEAPIEDRIEKVEEELKNVNKQMERLVEQLMGTITILCLPMPTSRKLELGFKMIEKIPDSILQVIVRRYIEEGKKSDVKFDDMIDPMVRIFGIERSWKLIDRETIKENYGELALNKWDELGRTHKCEE